MGRTVDLNKPLSAEDRQYLIERGRDYLIPANVRRFGTPENPREPDEHEREGSNALSPFYQDSQRQAAVYDVGGAPLPNTTLDYNTGRVADRVNGETVEFTGPGHTPGAFDLTPQRDAGYGGFDDGSDGVDLDEHGNPIDDNIDDDIVDYVTSIPNITELIRQLTELKPIAAEYGVNVEWRGDDKRDDLEIKLGVAIDDLRDKGIDVLAGNEEDGESENTEENENSEENSESTPGEDEENKE